MAADATFFFDTNIEQVVTEIREGLTKVAALQREQESNHGLPSNEANRVRALEDMNRVIDRTIAKFGQLGHAAKFDVANLGAKNLSAGMQTAASQADKELGRIAGRRGFSLEVGAEFRKDAMGKLIASANRAAKAASLTLPINIVGTRRISSSEGSFASGHAIGTAQINNRQSPSQLRRERHLARSERAAEVAANADEAAARTAKESERTNRRAQIGRLKATRRLEEALAASVKAIEDRAPELIHRAQPRNIAGAGAGGSGGRIPPGTPGVADGGNDEFAEGRRQQADFRAQRLLNAEGRYLTRLRKLGKTTEDINAEELHAEYLRGAVTRGPHKGQSRTSGFEKGVESFEGGRILADTRFGVTELAERTSRGYKELERGTEPFIRAQEAVGAAMAKQAEALFTASERDDLTKRTAANLKRAQANAERIRTGAVEGQRFAPKVIDLGKGLVSDQTEGQLNFLQKQTDGTYRDLARGTGEYLDAMARYVDGLIAERGKIDRARESAFAAVDRRIQAEAAAHQKTIDDAHDRAARLRSQDESADAKTGTGADKILKRRENLGAKDFVGEVATGEKILADERAAAQKKIDDDQATAEQLRKVDEDANAKLISQSDAALKRMEILDAKRYRDELSLAESHVRDAEAAARRRVDDDQATATRLRKIDEDANAKLITQAEAAQKRREILDAKRFRDELALAEKYVRDAEVAAQKRIDDDQQTAAQLRKVEEEANARLITQADAALKRMEILSAKRYRDEVATAEKILRDQEQANQRRLDASHTTAERLRALDDKAAAKIGPAADALLRKREDIENARTRKEEELGRRTLNDLATQGEARIRQQLKITRGVQQLLERQGKATEAAQSNAVRSLQTQRLTAGAAGGERFAPGVIETGPRSAVDTRNLRGKGLEYYDKASDGLFDQVTSGDALVLAQRRYADALNKAANEDFARDQVGRRGANLEHLREGAAPGQTFAKGVVPLDSGFVADLRGKVAEFYKKAGIGFERLGDDSYLHSVALSKLLNAQASEARSNYDKENKRSFAQTGRDNAARLSDPSTRSGFIDPNIVQYSNKGVADLREDVARFYRKIGDGLHELERGSQAYNDELTKLNRSGRSPKTKTAGFVRGLLSGGFGSSGNEGLAGLTQAAGTTAKYSALYAVMGMLQGAISQVGAEMVNFADSNTDLQIALEQSTDAVGKASSVDHEYLQTLEGISITAGSNVGDVQDIVAAGIRSIGLESSHSSAELKVLGAEFAEQSQRMAILAKTDIADAAGNIRAISSAYDVPLSSTSRINDALVTGKNVGGGDEKETAQAVATVGEAAKNAGFSLEAISTIASRIQGATDQSGQAVGNKLSKIFSIVGGSAGQKAITKLNAGLPDDKQIDTNATIYQQLLQLSKANDSLNTEQRKGLVNSLGGTSAAKEFITVLESLDEVVDNHGKGLNDAGAAGREYADRLKDLSVVVRELQGSLRAIIVNLANSGALDILVGGLKGVVEILKIIAHVGAQLNTYINKFDVLGDGAGRWAIRLAEVAAALALIGKVSATGGIQEFLLSAEKTFRPESALARQGLAQAAGGGLQDQVIDTAQEGVQDALAERVGNKIQSRVNSSVVAQAEDSISNVAFAAASSTATAATSAIAAEGAEINALLRGSTVAAATTASAATATTATSAAALVRAEITAAAATAGAAAGAAGAAGAAAGGAAGAARGAAGSAAGLGAAGALAGARAAINRGGAAAVGTLSRGIGSVFALVKNPITLAIGAFLAIGAIKGKADEVGAAMRGATRSLNATSQLPTLLKSKTTTEQIEIYRNQASDNATKRQELEAQRNSFVGRLFKSDQNTTQVKNLEAAEKFNTSQAERLENSLKNVGGGLRGIAVFGDPAVRTAESLAASMEQLQTQGYGAAQRIDLLNKALGIGGDDKGKPKEPVATRKSDIAAQAIANAMSLDANPDFADDLTIYERKQAWFDQQGYQFPIDGAAGKPPVQPTTIKKRTIANPLKSYFTQNAANLTKMLEDQLGDTALGKDGAYSDKQIRHAAHAVANKYEADYRKEFEKLSIQDRKKEENQPSYARKLAFIKIVSFLKTQGNVTSEAPKNQKIDAGTAGEEIATSIAAADALRSTQDGNPTAKIAATAKNLKDIDAIIARVKPGESIVALMEIRNGVFKSLVDQQTAEGEALRKAGQAKAKTATEIKKIGEDFFKKAVADNAAAGNEDALVTLFNEANTAEIAEARGVIVTAIKQQEAKAAAEEKKNAAIDAARVVLDQFTNRDYNYGSISPEDRKKAGEKKSGKEGRELKRQKDILKGFDNAQGKSTPDTEGGGSIATGEDTGGLSPLQKRQKATELAIAKRDANALGDAKLDAATRNLRNAKERLDDFAKKDKEYYDQLRVVNDAKLAVALAEQDGANSVAQLGIDLTDPVAVARQEVADAKARRALAVKAANKKGLKGGSKERADYLAGFEIDVRNKEAGLESTAVSEYLSNAQTSLRLGRISHSTYMALLKSKRDQLQIEYNSHAKDAQGQNARKKAIDSLNETIKGAASELDGQFNLGDIKIPTVYQVRRSIKAKTAGDVLGQNGSNSTAGNVVNDSSTQNVIMNGVPIEKIVTIIENLFGIKARTTTGKRRK